MKRQTFDHLSDDESAVVGAPDDYEWAAAVRAPSRRRGETTQFSLRIEKRLVATLDDIARERGVSFSEIVRDAISAYLGVASQAPQFYEVSGAGISVVHAATGTIRLPARLPESEARTTGVPEPAATT
jgi:hypothetical protein